MKRCLSLFLSFCMLLALLPPVPTQATESGDGAFALSSLSVSNDGSELQLDILAEADCTLVTALYERSGRQLFCSLTPVEGKNGEQELTVPVEKGNQTRYTAKAFLLDSVDSEPLCESASAEWADWMRYSMLTQPDGNYVAYDEAADLYYRSDILNVYLAHGASVYSVDDALSAVGGEIVGRSGALDLVQVKVNAATLDELAEQAEMLTDTFGFIRFANYDRLVPNLYCDATPVAPDDPWGTLLGDDSDWLDDDVDSNNWWLESIRAPYAWSYDAELSDICVGIVDGSFDQGHEDLKNVSRFATTALAELNDTTPWWDGWRPTEAHAWNFDQQVKDQKNAHGTHVAGIIGAEENNSKGITGLAWNAELLLAPLHSHSITEALAHVATLVEQGAKVVNVSFGSSEDLPEDATEYSEESILSCATEAAVAIAGLIDRGYDFVLVQSAGNGNRGNTLPVDAINNNLVASITAETPTHSQTTTAQDVLDRCLIVTATDSTGTLLRYANFGSQVDIAAPGADIYSTLPGDIMTDTEINGGYGTMSGTSMATPVVAGVCAMVWSVSEDFTAKQVCDIVTTSTEKVAYPHHASGNSATYPLVDALAAVETAIQFRDGKIPLTINIQYADGTPATGVTVEGTGLETAPVTDKYGTAFCYVAPDRYLITANPEGWYDEQDVTISRKTVVNLTLEETWFTWSLDAAGTALTVDGYGPMPDYATDSSYGQTPPWGRDITSASINGVSTVGENAFFYCANLSQVTLGDSVRKIGGKAFYPSRSSGSALTSIALPDRLFEIGAEAFYDTALTSLVVPGSVHTIGDSAFSSTPITSLTLENGIVRIGEDAFAVCQSLLGVHIPSSVVEIGDGAFYALTSATSITLGGGKLKSIGDGAFGSCYQLTSFTVPDDVTEIPQSMLGSCLALKTVSIPESVTSIGVNAFAQCSSLKTVKLPSKLTELEYGAFYECKALESIAIPDGVTEIGDQTFYKCPALRSVTLPKNLTRIGEEAFYQCTALASISFPDTLEYIGDYAFTECSSLQSVTIPAKTQTGHAFSKCTGLKTVTIKEGAYLVYGYAFSGCTSLSTVILPSTLMGIYSYAFYGCTALSHIDLPASMMYVEEHAFADSGLKTATFAGSSAAWEKAYIFDETLNNASITFLG